MKWSNQDEARGFIGGGPDNQGFVTLTNIVSSNVPKTGQGSMNFTISEEEPSRVGLTLWSPTGKPNGSRWSSIIGSVYILNCVRC